MYRFKERSTEQIPKFYVFFQFSILESDFRSMLLWWLWPFVKVSFLKETVYQSLILTLLNLNFCRKGQSDANFSSSRLYF